MAAYLLLPGLGGSAQQLLTGTSVTGDTFGMERCSAFDLEQSVFNGSGHGGSFIVQERISSTGAWNTLGSAITVSSTNTIAKFEATTRQFGTIRINPASTSGLSAANNIVLTLVGYRQPSGY